MDIKFELEWHKSKDKELTLLFMNIFNVSDSVHCFFFFRLVTRLKHYNYRNCLKGNKNYFELAGGSSYIEGKIIVNVWWKSKGNWVSFELAQGFPFELSGVNCKCWLRKRMNHRRKTCKQQRQHKFCGEGVFTESNLKYLFVWQELKPETCQPALAVWAPRLMKAFDQVWALT